VLQATAMPSILVETGFITNPQEEDYLNSENGQQEIAECITNALKNYKAWLEKKQTITTDNTNSQVPSSPAKQTDNYAFLKELDRQEQNRRAK
jgi:N-acetylmuramoyl-L-alanine amidase